MIREDLIGGGQIQNIVLTDSDFQSPFTKYQNNSRVIANDKVAILHIQFKVGEVTTEGWAKVCTLPVKSRYTQYTSTFLVSNMQGDNLVIRDFRIDGNEFAVYVRTTDNNKYAWVDMTYIPA